MPEKKEEEEDDRQQKSLCNTALSYTSTNSTHSVRGTIILQNTAFTKSHVLYCTSRSDTKTLRTDTSLPS